MGLRYGQYLPVHRSYVTSRKFTLPILNDNNALRDSGFNANIAYNARATRNLRRKRNIIWFNPPYNAQVETNVGRVFLNIVKKHFIHRHKYHKLFNKNNIKISYSCMPNMKSIIARHNKKVLNNEVLPTASITCNCPQDNRVNCPLDGMCLSGSIVYNASVTSNGETKVYTGATQPEFKKRFRNHTHSFSNRAKETDTTLSRYIWQLKDRETGYNIKWSLYRQSFPYKCGSRKCDLCLSEKLAILKSDPDLSLNKRFEIMNKCRHRMQCKLSSVT